MLLKKNSFVMTISKNIKLITAKFIPNRRKERVIAMILRIKSIDYHRQVTHEIEPNTNSEIKYLSQSKNRFVR